MFLGIVLAVCFANNYEKSLEKFRSAKEKFEEYCQKNIIAGFV
jgi:hypothetical protein